MSSESQDPTPESGGHSTLGRLRGMFQSSTDSPENQPEEATPAEQGETEGETSPPTAEPVAQDFASIDTDEIPEAHPVSPEAETDSEAEPEATPVAESTDDAPPVTTPCPVCQSDCVPGQTSCSDCGYHFPEGAPPPPAPKSESGDEEVPSAIPVAEVASTPTISVRLKNRYEMMEQIGERLGVFRHRGIDLGLTGDESKPIVIVRQILPTDSSAPESEAELELAPDLDPDSEDTSLGEEEILPSFDNPDELLAAGPPTEELPSPPRWPNLAWERHILETVEHPGLPSVIDTFVENGTEYMILELPEGTSLWDAWDDFDVNNKQRYTWLKELAETLLMLQQIGGMIEGIRPDIVVIDEQGQVRLTDLSDLLPLPLPENPPIRGTLWTAPEMLSSPEKVDGRATLYSFGALMFALQMGRELADIDFEGPGQPKPYIPQFPDCHPMVGRLMSKTFRRDPNQRFPTDETAKDDPTGVGELIRNLEICARTLDQTRLEIGAWTTTGMVRSGNEDAFSLLHSCESRQDDVTETALILLADGMGGYEAGEVAAAMAMAELRRILCQHPQFRALTGVSGFSDDLPQADGNDAAEIDVEQMKELILAALKEANSKVHNEAKANPSRRGMGCTAEVVFIDGKNIVVGHVGDSRTYHLSDGNLTQLTRDQTLVNRLVELGQLTEEEAEKHPRRNELQQALGGQPQVDPGVYSATLKAGDVILVCSDGVVNHVDNKTLRKFLVEEGFAAELAARRLVNLTNINGATDNTTIVVIRAT